MSAVWQPEVQWRRIGLEQVKDELVVHLAVGAGHIPLLVRLLCLHSSNHTDRNNNSDGRSNNALITHSCVSSPSDHSRACDGLCESRLGFAF